MNYFQLNDGEGDSMGMLCTDLTEPEIQEEWTKYIAQGSNNFSVEDFVEEVLKIKFSHMTSERFFIDAEINP